MDICEHWPRGSIAKTVVYKEECMYCFRTWDSPDWIEVCAVCMQGFCPEHFIFHSMSHSAHRCSLRSSRRTIEMKDADDEEKKHKQARVDIAGQPVLYDHSFFPYCHQCQRQLSIDGDDSLLRAVKDSAEARKVIVSAWTEEIKPCEHITSLVQSPSRAINLRQCAHCEIQENLWMCLACGEIGCGRKQFDGSGGNGHASGHYAQSRHSCSIKLGTLASAQPDVHCYSCDEMVLDEHLDEHLALFLIDRSSILPEKGMAELQWQQNSQFNFSMATEDGKEYDEAVNLRGIHNLGNSCYLSSVMQPLSRLINFIPHDISKCRLEPKNCLSCQFQKLANALKSNVKHEVHPWMFKSLVGKGHAEFSSARQQDAAEFFVHVLKSCKLYDPFSFKLQQTLKCPHCGFTKSSQNSCDLLQTDLASFADLESVDGQELIEEFFSEESVESSCPKCSNSTLQKQYGVIEGPKECLAVVVGRTEMKDWIPKKIDKSISLPKIIDLKRYIEPEHTFKADEVALEQLIGMGFDKESSVKALSAADNDFEEAMNMLLSGKFHQSSVNSEDVNALVDFGFDRELVQKALAIGGDRDAACEILLNTPEVLLTANVENLEGHRETMMDDATEYSLKAFISHKGPSMHCGHYIVHLFDESSKRWALFNDDKVYYLSESNGDEVPDCSLAYMAFYVKNKLHYV